MRETENIAAYNKILDFIRLGSIIVLLVHFYCVCFSAVQVWQLSLPIIDKLIFNITQKVDFLSGINKPKLTALFLLGISLIGGKGKKDENLKIGPVIFYICIGVVLYFLSSLFLFLD